MTAWIPRPANDTIDGLVWLPRMIEKARRFAQGRRTGTDLMNGYLYGDNDFVDAQVLAFLRTDDRALLGLVEQSPSDDQAARAAISRSGRSHDECAAFSSALRRKVMGFVMLDADEGRLPPGPRRAIVAFFYNRVVMPIFYAAFRRAEAKRPAAMP